MRRPVAAGLTVFAVLIFVLLCIGGCAGNGNSVVQQAAGDIASARDARAVVLTPGADGTKVFADADSVIDASHLEDGYVMVKYTGADGKIKLQLTKDGGETYTYDLPASGVFQTFPLTVGDGSYTLNIYRNVSGDQYAFLFGATLDVRLKDEFTPFLYPNQYVDFNQDSAAVALSEELAKTASDDLGVVGNIYDYVVGNITYDTAKAENVPSSYLPDIDDTLETGKGICFDYAALMTAMLRVQRIPTRLVIGYAGQDYHAWISVYTEETGWIDGIIQFDGKNWVRMDPTFAAGKGLAQYIGDGSHYNAMFYY